MKKSAVLRNIPAIVLCLVLVVCALPSMGIVHAASERSYSIYEEQMEIPEEGMYEITIEYIQPEDNTRDLTIDVEVNGRLPFAEAKGITLPRIYRNDGDIRRDANGNEIAPRQVMVLEPVCHTLMNTSGFYEGNYQFPMEKG